VNLVLFNFHDTVLLITLYQSGLLLLASVFAAARNPRLAIFSGLFFLSCGAIPLDKLIRFGAEFHPWAVEFLPQSLYLLEMGYWLQGPLFLWMLRSFLDAEYRPRARDAIYLLPFLLFLLHQILAYYNYHEATPASADEAPDGADLMTIYFIVLCRELLRLYFAVMAATELFVYLRGLGGKAHSMAALEKRSDFTPAIDSVVFGRNQKELDGGQVYFGAVPILVVGVLLLWGLGCVVSFGLIVNVKFAIGFPVEFLGLSANYINCMLFSAVLIAGFKGFSLPQKCVVDSFEPHQAVRDDGRSSSAKQKVAEPSVNPEYVRKLDQLVETDRVYLEANLTLEALARRIGVSARTLSTVLKAHYECNFFEFINRYRIAEAKRLMVAESTRDATMVEIMTAAGFNSKATFNSIFKKMEGVTPRQYKKQNLPS